MADDLKAQISHCLEMAIECRLRARAAHDLDAQALWSAVAAKWQTLAQNYEQIASAQAVLRDLYRWADAAEAPRAGVPARR